MSPAPKDFPIRVGPSLLPGAEANVEIRRAVVDIDTLYEKITLAGLASRLLVASERSIFERIKHTRRRREWLAGRLLAKTLALAALGGASIDAELREIVVERDHAGAPYLTASGSRQTAALLERRTSLSISHSSGRAGALLAFGAEALVGVDIERVRPRSSGFVRRVFTRAELEHLVGVSGDETSAVILGWTLKEATAKAMGRGLPLLVPWDVRISTFEASGRARLELHGTAQRRFSELAATRIVTRAVLDGDHATADVLITKEDRDDARLRRSD